MTEEEAEEGITPEVLPSTQLATIIKETKLDAELADEFKINFEEHFRMASDWSKKAKTIIVTNENQTVLMEQARVARLFIRGKRLEIENFRKSKKEYYLRGGQAVDKVCGFLKNMIEPIENHLDLQEHFVQYREKAKNDAILAEAKAKEESELLAKQKAEQEELERLRKEKQDQMKKEADLQREKLALKQASDNQKLINYRTKIKSLIDEFPEIKDPALVRWSEDAKSYLWLAHSTLNQINNEEEE